MARGSTSPEKLIGELRRADSAAARSRARERALSRLGVGRFRGDVDLTALRMALAAHDRRHGEPSQAGRWGIVTEGWATTRELRDLRRYLLGQFSEGDYVRSVLLLPPDATLPGAVADLVDPAFRPPRAGETVTSGPGCVLALGATISGLTAFMLLYVIVWNVLTSGNVASAPMLALLSAAAALVCVGFVLAVRARGPRPSATSSPAIEPRDRFFGTSLAWRLHDAGDDRASRILLRRMIELDIDGDGARAAMVEQSRMAGRLDEAGRWGCAKPGLSTPAERTAFAEQLRASPVESRLRELAGIPTPLPLPSDARDVLRRAGGEPTEPVEQTESDDGFGTRWKALPLVTFVMLGLAIAVALIVAIAQVPEAPLIARVTLACSGAIVGVLWIIESFLLPRRRTAATLAAAVGALALSTLLGVSAIFG
ncbi:hypothetical protein PP359_09950 [Sphingomonas sp. BLCC-B65]|nr:hypothetical protein [Sphingomonas sp. BLCC-B65]